MYSILIKELGHKGYHYQLNYKKSAETHGIVLAKYRTAILLMMSFGTGRILIKRKGK